jgi:hypothetical protein
VNRHKFARELADSIWRLHNVTQKQRSAEPLKSDGFTSAPLWMIWIGHQQWRDSGIMPSRQEIGRLERSWINDIYLLDDMIERARPEPKGAE